MPLAGTQALTQQYARLQQQLALMAQQNSGGFPFLPPPGLGGANPFSGLNAQQVTNLCAPHPVPDTELQIRSDTVLVAVLGDCALGFGSQTPLPLDCSLLGTLCSVRAVLRRGSFLSWLS